MAGMIEELMMEGEARGRWWASDGPPCPGPAMWYDAWTDGMAFRMSIETKG